MRRKRRVTHSAWFVGKDGREPGKLYRRSRMYWTGDNTERSGGANTVAYTIAKTNAGTRKGVEKRYYREYANPEEDFRILEDLRKSGAHVLPGIRIAITRKREGRKWKLEKSLEMPDLTERGKKLVIPINLVLNNQGYYNLVNGLTNAKEIWASIRSDQEILRKKRYWSNSDNWLFVIDKKAGTGEAFLTDTDATFSWPHAGETRYFGEEEQSKHFTHWQATRRGVVPTYLEMKRIDRRASNPMSSIAAELAKTAGQNKTELMKAVNYHTLKGVASNIARLERA
jgi:hypothetical protein